MGDQQAITTQILFRRRQKLDAENSMNWIALDVAPLLIKQGLAMSDPTVSRVLRHLILFKRQINFYMSLKWFLRHII